jgi:hypothetical protein
MKQLETVLGLLGVTVTLAALAFILVGSYAGW